MPRGLAGLRVGHLRALIKDVPDDAVVMPEFLPDDIPHDGEPGVELVGFQAYTGKNDDPLLKIGLIAHVRLAYAEDAAEDEDDEDADDEPT